MHKIFSFQLFKREMKSLWIMLLIFIALLSMYISVITSMFDPKAASQLDDFFKSMPQLMSAVGMSAGATTLIGHLASYLYGFILLIVPLIFTIICANNLVARYTDRGSMVSLISAPIKRSAVVFTQMLVLLFSILILIVYATCLEIVVSHAMFWGQLDIEKLILLNFGLLGLHFFIGSICFLFSCAFSDVKNSLTYGAGIPIVMFILQALANMGGKAENVKYFTFFTLFQPSNIIAYQHNAYWGMASLLAAAIVLFSIAIAIFSKKDLNI